MQVPHRMGTILDPNVHDDNEQPAFLGQSHLNYERFLIDRKHHQLYFLKHHDRLGGNSSLLSLHLLIFLIHQIDF